MKNLLPRGNLLTFVCRKAGVLEWLFGVFVTVRKEIIIIHVIVLAIRDIQKKNHVNYANFFPIIQHDRVNHYSGRTVVVRPL